MIHAALGAAAAAVEGALLLPKQPERRESGPGQDVRPVENRRGRGHFRHSAGRELQVPRGCGFGSDYDVGAGSGLPGLLLPLERHRRQRVERRRRRPMLRRQRRGEFVIICGEIALCHVLGVSAIGLMRNYS